MLDLGDALRQQPYRQYQGQRIADITPDQNLAFNEVRGVNAGIGNMTDAAFNGPNAGSIGAANDAIRQTRGTLSGDYLNGPNANPYSRNNPFASQGNQYIGQTNSFSDSTNPYATQSNQYIGENPYYNSVKQRGMADIAQNYQSAIAPDLKGQMVLNGTLGGGAEDQLRQRNELALGKSLTDYGMSMDNQNYDRSANLQGQDLMRQGSQMGADLQRRGDLVNQDLSRNMSGQAADLSRQGSLYDSFLNRGSGNYENERQRQMGAIGLGNDQQGLAQQRAQMLLGVGDANRSYQQDLLNQGYQDFQAQQNYPFQMADWYTGLLSRAQGGMSPNSVTTQSGYTASPFSQLTGAGLLAYGMRG